MGNAAVIRRSKKAGAIRMRKSRYRRRVVLDKANFDRAERKGLLSSSLSGGAYTFCIAVPSSGSIPPALAPIIQAYPWLSRKFISACCIRLKRRMQQAHIDVYGSEARKRVSFLTAPPLQCCSLKGRHLFPRL